MKAILIAGGTVALPGCHPLLGRPGSSSLHALDAGAHPALPDWLDPADFIVHSENPLTLEVRRSELGSGVITPVSRFFVRNNLPMPPGPIAADPDRWMLEVDGVAEPRSISLADLKGLGIETEGAVLQCSGNGRAFFEHGPSGSPWGTGAAGCALWTGVRVATLLEHLGGVDPAARFLTSTGGESLPDGLDRDTLVVERSIPIEKASNDALLAWEMNGAPIPVLHGGPLRLVVPGYFGVNSIKYVRRIACTPEESTAKIQQSGYRFRDVGSPGDASQPSMWRMPVKSWINGPGADGTPALAGDVTFYGVALSGERGIRRVEVSLDRGATWQEARLDGPDLGPNAWRAFTYTTRLAPGRETVVSRATDAAGDVQPRDRVENERGYGHNGWLDAALHLELVTELPEAATSRAAGARSAASPETPRPARDIELSDAALRGREIYQSATPPCGACHTLADAQSQGNVGFDLDNLKPGAEQVEKAIIGGVGAMPPYQSSLSPEQVKDLVAYIVEATR